ncbi:MAG: hypothetical protein M3Y07_04100 [Acidobacteriota bacterium]|nr:hypothetical protein [Acidobacteriota bacterium]
MAIYRGFVQSVEVRGDGWAEIVLEAVHAGNGTQTFFIPNLDGDLTQTNKRLAQVSLLRDALARVLPVQLDYTGTTDQGNLVDNVTVFPRPSIDGRLGGREVSGVVIGVGITELGPLSGTSPYLDAPDLAMIMLLTDAGAVQGYFLDLQRPDPLTAQAELRLLQRAHQTRRPVVVLIATDFQGNDRNPAVASNLRGAAAAQTAPKEYIVASRWVTVTEANLDYMYGFVERLGQRYESFTSSSAPALSHVKVVYTTAPGQTPEGDISDNGAFSPQRLTAWVHDASPLLARLEAALRDNLQVKLGLSDNQVHEVELVSHLGSAARPIWIVEECRFTSEEGDGACVNTPTVQGPSGVSINNVPRSLVWHGKGYFQEGIWRFVLESGIAAKLKIDGHQICCRQPSAAPSPEHAYLKGMHCVDLELSGVSCASNVSIQIYRIR